MENLAAIITPKWMGKWIYLYQTNIITFAAAEKAAIILAGLLCPTGTATDDSRPKTGFVICPSHTRTRDGPAAIKMEIHYDASAECSLEWREATSH